MIPKVGEIWDLDDRYGVVKVTHVLNNGYEEKVHFIRLRDRLKQWAHPYWFGKDRPYHRPPINITTNLSNLIYGVGNDI